MEAIGPVKDLGTFGQAVDATEQLLDSMGVSQVEQEGLQETPKRVAKMWLDELTSGYKVNIEQLFRNFDSEGYEGQVIVKEIPVRSVCEHHLVPIIGYCYIGYFPAGRVLGLSKLARIVDAFSRRLQVQERLTQQIVDAIAEHLKPRGVIVAIDAEHMCMTMRGVQAPGTRTSTCTVTGLYKEEQGTKDEFLRLCQLNGHK